MAFSESSMFTNVPDAARYLGRPYSTFAHAECDNICLLEFRRRQGKRYVVLTRQLIDHAARVLAYGSCGGECKETAKRVIQEAREFLNRKDG